MPSSSDRPIFWEKISSKTKQIRLFVFIQEPPRGTHHFATLKKKSKLACVLCANLSGPGSQIGNAPLFCRQHFSTLDSYTIASRVPAGGKNTRTKDRGGGGEGRWAYKREKRGGKRRIWPLGGHSQRIQRANVNSSWRTENRISIRAGSTVHPCHTAGGARAGL